MKENMESKNEALLYSCMYCIKKKFPIHVMDKQSQTVRENLLVDCSSLEIVTEYHCSEKHTVTQKIHKTKIIKQIQCVC